MVKKKKTLNQLEYEKALKNLKRRIKAAEKRGFRFDKSELFPSEKPKRITKKRIESIKKLNIYYLWYHNRWCPFCFQEHFL